MRNYRSESFATVNEESSDSSFESDTSSMSLPDPETIDQDAPDISEQSQRPVVIFSCVGSNFQFTQMHQHAQRNEIEYQSGDCGYRAMNVTRHEAYTLLRNRLLADRKIISLLRPVVKEALLEEPFIRWIEARGRAPIGLRAAFDEVNNHQDNAGTMDDDFMERLYRFAGYFAVIQAYLDYDIRDREIHSGWAHPCILQAIAHTKHVKLRLWQVTAGQATSIVPLQDYHLYEDIGGDYIDILFINGNHFERMEVYPKLPAPFNPPAHNHTPMTPRAVLQQEQKRQRTVHKRLEGLIASLTEFEEDKVNQTLNTLANPQSRPGFDKIYREIVEHIKRIDHYPVQYGNTPALNKLCQGTKMVYQNILRSLALNAEMKKKMLIEMSYGYYANELAKIRGTFKKPRYQTLWLAWLDEIEALYDKKFSKIVTQEIVRVGNMLSLLPNYKPEGLVTCKNTLSWDTSWLNQYIQIHGDEKKLITAVISQCNTIIRSIHIKLALHQSNLPAATLRAYQADLRTFWSNPLFAEPHFQTAWEAWITNIGQVLESRLVDTPLPFQRAARRIDNSHIKAKTNLSQTSVAQSQSVDAVEEATQIVSTLLRDLLPNEKLNNDHIVNIRDNLKNARSRLLISKDKLTDKVKFRKEYDAYYHSLDKVFDIVLTTINHMVQSIDDIKNNKEKYSVAIEKFVNKDPNSNVHVVEQKRSALIQVMGDHFADQMKKLTEQIKKFRDPSEFSALIEFLKKLEIYYDNDVPAITPASPTNLASLTTQLDNVKESVERTLNDFRGRNIAKPTSFQDPAPYRNAVQAYYHELADRLRGFENQAGEILIQLSVNANQVRRQVFSCIQEQLSLASIILVTIENMNAIYSQNGAGNPDSAVRIQYSIDKLREICRHAPQDTMLSEFLDTLYPRANPRLSRLSVFKPKFTDVGATLAAVMPGLSQLRK